MRDALGLSKPALYRLQAVRAPHIHPCYSFITRPRSATSTPQVRSDVDFASGDHDLIAQASTFLCVAAVAADPRRKRVRSVPGSIYAVFDGCPISFIAACACGEQISGVHMCLVNVCICARFDRCRRMAGLHHMREMQSDARLCSGVGSAARYLVPDAIWMAFANVSDRRRKVSCYCFAGSGTV